MLQMCYLIALKNQDDSNSKLGGKNYHIVTSSNSVLVVLYVSFSILKIILTIKSHSLLTQKYPDLPQFNVYAMYQTLEFVN